MKFTNTINVLNEFADLLIETYKGKLASEGWQGGQLYNSVKKVSIKQANSNFEIVLSLEEYWKYIEYGRKAGKQANRKKMPPITEIRKWIEKKAIIPRPIKLKSGKQYSPTKNTLAFLISRSILKNGFKNPVPAKPLLQDTITDVRTNFIERIKEALTSDIINEGYNIKQ